MTIKFNIKGIQPVDDSGGGGSSGGVAKYAIVVDQSGIHTPLITNNMTLSCYSYDNNYMRLDTQLFKIDNDIIDAATLLLKPYADGGNLLGYVDDGSAVNLKLYALHPDGQSHEMLVNFVRPDLTADGTMGGDDFACSADSSIDANRLPFKAFDGVTEMASVYTDMWHSNSGQPHWIAFYNPNPLIVNAVTIYNAMDTTVPYEWKFQYSDDGTDWTDCASGTNTEFTENASWSFNVSDSGEHKYYRFYTTSAHGATDTYTSIAEIQIQGVERKTVVATDYKYVLAKDNTFNLPTGYNGSVLVGKIYLPAHYYNDNGSWQMGTGGEEPADDKTPVLRSLTVTPTTSAQTIMPDNDIDGYVPVYVEAFNGYTEFPRYEIENGTAKPSIKALPNNFLSDVTSINDYTFQYAWQKTAPVSGTVDLSNVTYVGSYGLANAFTACSHINANLDFSKLAGTVWQNAFYYTFQGCTGITGSVDLSKVTTVKSNAFYYTFQGCTGITGADLSGITTVEQGGLSNMFANCSNLTGAIDLSKITTVGNSSLASTFQNTGITSIDLSGITSVTNYSLQSVCRNCTALTSVDLSGVTSVSTYGFQYAFSGCTSLTSVDLGTITTLSGTNVFDNMFNGCTSLTTVDLSGITEIGKNQFSNTFKNCTALTSVDLSGVISISGDDALRELFKDCTSLTTVDFSGLQTTTSSMVNGVFLDAFNGCTSLTSIDFSALVTVNGEFGRRAFKGSGIKTVTFDNLTTFVDSSSFPAFQDVFKDSSIETVRFPKLNITTTILSFYETFTDCAGLKDVYFNAFNSTDLPDNSSILAYAFNTTTGSTSGGFTLHFPSNMATKVAALRGYPNFGADSNLITLAFDLPATA